MRDAPPPLVVAARRVHGTPSRGKLESEQPHYTIGEEKGSLFLVVYYYSIHTTTTTARISAREKEKTTTWGGVGRLFFVGSSALSVHTPRRGVKPVASPFSLRLLSPSCCVCTPESA